MLCNCLVGMVGRGYDSDGLRTTVQYKWVYVFTPAVACVATNVFDGSPVLLPVYVRLKFSILSDT